MKDLISRGLKLEKACKLLKPYLNKNEILDSIHELDDTLDVSLPSFSNYIHTAEGKYPTSSTDKFDRILDVVDKLVLYELCMVWNENKGEYVKRKQKVGEKIDEETEKKLNGLKGIWEVYLWRRAVYETENTNNILVFKMKIGDCDRVLCHSKSVTFHHGNIRMVGGDKLAFEFTKDNGRRRMYMFAKIGEIEDLRNIRGINIAYIDTGSENVKCGIAHIKRVDKGVKYSDIKVKDIPLTEFDTDLGEFLNQKQHFAPIYMEKINKESINKAEDTVK